MTKTPAVLYWVDACADAALAGSTSAWAQRLRWLTKPVLMPLLLGARGDAVALPLAGSAVGDVALLGARTAARLAGIAGFAAAHVAYLDALRSPDEGGTVDPGPLFGIAALAGGVASAPIGWRIWRSGASTPTRVAAIGYGALVSAMAARAGQVGVRRGGRAGVQLLAGGALFAASDALVAISWFVPLSRRRRAAVEAGVMLSYAAAQWLLTGGLVAPDRE